MSYDLMVFEAKDAPRERDRFGLRTRRVHAPTLLRDIADRLNAMSGCRETEALHAYLEDVLRSPYWGLRILAIRVYAGWGGRRNKAWLMERAARSTAHDTKPDSATPWHVIETLTARRELVGLLTAKDGEWLLEAWLNDGGMSFYHLAKWLAFIPEEQLLSRLKQEIASDNSRRRRGVLSILSCIRSLPDRQEMLKCLANDVEPDIRNFAEFLHRRDRVSQLIEEPETAAPRPRNKERSRMSMRQFRVNR